MNWWMYALLGAITWGLHYNLVAKSMTSASPLTVYFLPNILLVASLPFWYKTLVQDVQQILASPPTIKISVAVMMFTSIIGSVAVYKAIHSSNATYASLIEIAYPLFVALFAYVIFRENHLNWEVTLGGMLVLMGTMLIIVKG